MDGIKGFSVKPHHDSAELTDRAVLNDILAVVGDSPRVVVLHSSFAHLYAGRTVRRGELIGLLRGLLRASHTLAIPTFTLSFLREGKYHWRDTRPDTGVLAETALTMHEFVRTNDPIYSYALAGTQSHLFDVAPAATTFGDDSIFARFEQENAVLVMAGCGWRYCTQFHRHEEEANVPYRFFKEFRGSADFGAGMQDICTRMFVRHLDVEATTDFTRAEALLASAGLLNTAPVAGRKIQSVQCKPFANAVRSLLGKDPYALVRDRARTAFKVEARKRTEANPPVKIALLGNANLELVSAALETQMASLLCDCRSIVHTVPFGRVAQECIDENSALHAFDATVSFFLDRAEDLVGELSLDGIDADTIAAAVDTYIAAIRAYRERRKGWLVVSRFIASTPSNTRQIDQLNQQLEAGLDGLPEVSFVDIQALANRFQDSAVIDDRLWYLGRFSFSEPFSRRFADHLSGLVLAATGRTARLVAVDLDNTLWGGIIGEDGAKGLRIGGDYPGNAYRAFQRTLKALGERGIALALLSKNDHDQAMAAIDSLPGMVLRSDDFVAHRVDWNPKPENLRMILEELQLGAGNVLFIDDNPVEREAMRQQMPEVAVLELPPDPADFVDTVLASPHLATLGLTEEDLQRVENYKKRAIFERERTASGDITDFYRGLDLTITINPLDEGNAARASQLMQKTNQFNTTTRRYSLHELEQFASTEGDVYVIGLEDRFNPFENMGVMTVRRDKAAAGWLEVDDYLLSCRALGRGAETTVLRWLLGRAQERGYDGIRGTIDETDRNAPCRTVFSDAGFKEIDGTWCFDFRRMTVPELDDWVGMRDGCAIGKASLW